VSALLLVRLKIPDLTAWTAMDAARALLAARGPNGKAIEVTRLVREEVYLFEAAPGRAAESFEAGLARAIDTSNFFVNPNKESFRLSRSADRGKAWAPPEGAWGILSRSRGDTRDLGLNERLQREHPLPDLGAIRRARVWWLWTKAPDGGPGIGAAYEAVGPVVDAGRGLLVNPHSEASLRMDGPTAWSRVESFLAESAPTLTAA
jgi:hypothetical protein